MDSKFSVVSTMQGKAFNTMAAWNPCEPKTNRKLLFFFFFSGVVTSTDFVIHVIFTANMSNCV